MKTAEIHIAQGHNKVRLAITKNRVTVHQLPLISSVGTPVKSWANCQTVKPPHFTWENQIAACQKQISLRPFQSF